MNKRTAPKGDPAVNTTTGTPGPKRSTATKSPGAEPMEPFSYQFTGELFVWSGGQTNWYFIRMPVSQSTELREQMDGLTNGFGSIRVEATIEDSTWRTSVFPESATGRYMLPVKKQIRRAAEIEDGDAVDVLLTVLHHNAAAPSI
jgi:Domain of unknown function (DUF1905)